MRYALKDFQRTAVAEVLEEITAGIENHRSTRNNRRPGRMAFALSSVTGSGKTVMAAAVCEALLAGSDDLEVSTQTDLAILWVTYDPALGGQSKTSFEQTMNATVGTRGEVITAESFKEDRLHPGKIYFLSLPLLGGTNRLVRPTEDRPHTFWDVLATTVADEGITLLVIVDEAHLGMGGRRSNEDRSLLERVLVGHGPHPGVSLVWGISATPKRFDERVKVLMPGAAGQNVVVSPADVQASGLLKSSVSLYQPQESTSMVFTMLQRALEDLRRLTRAWDGYHQENGGPQVLPLMVVQLPNRTDSQDHRAEDELIAQVVDQVDQVLCRGSNRRPSQVIAHVLPDRGVIEAGGARIRGIDPNHVQDDDAVQVLLAKESISTGWNCPRAEVLVSLRPQVDPTTIAQIVGRMVRNPLAQATGLDELDRAHVWVPYFKTEHVREVVGMLSGGIDPQVGQEDSAQRVEVEVQPVLATLGGPALARLTGRDDDQDSYRPLEVEVNAVRWSELAQQAQVGDTHSQALEHTESDEHEFGPSDTVQTAQVGQDEQVEPGSQIEQAEHVESDAGQADLIRRAIAVLLNLEREIAPPARPTSSLRRLREMYAVLGATGLMADSTQKGRSRRVELLESALVAHPEPFEKRLEEVRTVDVGRTDARLGGDQRYENVRLAAGLDALDAELKDASNRSDNLAQELYTVRANAIEDGGGRVNQLEEKAKAAAACSTPEVMSTLQGMVDSEIKELADRYGREVNLKRKKHPEQVSQWDRLLTGGSSSSTARLEVPVSKHLPSMDADGRVLEQLGKNLYADAQGLWNVPANTNEWERQVMRTEADRATTVLWYRNPGAVGKGSFSVVWYDDQEARWHSVQPDVLVVEGEPDDLRVSVVDPHWGNDPYLLRRITEMARYVAERRGTFHRWECLMEVDGEMRSVDLVTPQAQRAVGTVGSVAELFVQYGREYR